MADKEKHRFPFAVVDGDNVQESLTANEPDADNDEAMLIKIAHLEQEHRDLDQAILSMEERMPYERLTLKRMKKRKLALKDEIVRLKDLVMPDIIA